MLGIRLKLSPALLGFGLSLAKTAKKFLNQNLAEFCQFLDVFSVWVDPHIHTIYQHILGSIFHKYPMKSFIFNTFRRFKNNKSDVKDPDRKYLIAHFLTKIFTKHEKSTKENNSLRQGLNYHNTFNCKEIKKIIHRKIHLHRPFLIF